MQADVSALHRRNLRGRFSEISSTSFGVTFCLPPTGGDGHRRRSRPSEAMRSQRRCVRRAKEIAFSVLTPSSCRRHIHHPRDARAGAEHPRSPALPPRE
jgi:hypothetical protein